MVENVAKLPVYSLTGAPNVGERFYYLKTEATPIPKVDSTQSQILTMSKVFQKETEDFVNC